MPAADCDFEHARPYARDGTTCGCNCWACSRSCHRLKHTTRWDMRETAPGYHQWTGPSGRTYTQGPATYPV